MLFIVFIVFVDDVFHVDIFVVHGKHMGDKTRGRHQTGVNGRAVNGDRDLYWSEDDATIF